MGISWWLHVKLLKSFIFTSIQYKQIKNKKYKYSIITVKKNTCVVEKETENLT